jgi:peptidoglycan/xylan/chitin deacetylase (PgdA/CDA1 family)
VCLTLDLEPDYSGRLDPVYSSWDRGGLDALLDVLARFGGRVSVFVVGECLRARPEAVARLAQAGAEMHLHSHSHDLARPDSLEEIQKGVAAFEGFFSRRPRGYRAPEGRISPEGWSRLEAEGFEFDSSIFPSFWPAPRYLLYRPEPFRPRGTRLLELPISTLSPARLIVSLSWMKLLGFGLYRTLLETAPWPEPLVFDMHLHDLVSTDSYTRLPPVWRAIYGRNRHRGPAILEEFLGLVVRRGARFRTLGEVATSLGTAPAVAPGAVLTS